MSNVTQMQPVATDALQKARADYLYGELKEERWSLRLLQDRTGIPKSTLSSKLNGASPILVADIELFAAVLKRDPVELFSAYLAVTPDSPVGGSAEPPASTVITGRFNPDHMGELIHFPKGA